jgi:hypothetical protein
MEEIKEVLHMIEKLPEITLWVLGGFAVYKLVTYLSTMGAFVVVTKLAINKAYDAWAIPRDKVKVIEHNKWNDHIFIDNAYDTFKVLLTEMKMEQNRSPRNVSLSCIHNDVVLLALDAFREKVEAIKLESR